MYSLSPSLAYERMIDAVDELLGAEKPQYFSVEFLVVYSND